MDCFNRARQNRSHKNVCYLLYFVQNLVIAFLFLFGTRLTPVYMLVLMLFATCFNYFGSAGPLAHPSLKMTSDCKENWWSHLIYLNNLYPIPNEVSLIAPQNKTSSGVWTKVFKKKYGLFGIIVDIIEWISYVRVHVQCRPK